MPPGLPLVSTLEVNTMDLTTLITACALTVDPKIMHALIWHQSGGEPWAFSVSGQRQPQVLRNIEDAAWCRACHSPGKYRHPGRPGRRAGHASRDHGDDVHPMLEHRLGRAADCAVC